jgi:hypothetical protein
VAKKHIPLETLRRIRTALITEVAHRRWRHIRTKKVYYVSDIVFIHDEVGLSASVVYHEAGVPFSAEAPLVMKSREFLSKFIEVKEEDG